MNSDRAPLAWRRWIVGLVLGVCLWTGTAQAVITRLTPLAEVLESSTFIVTAKIESLDADRPAMMLVIDESLKGRFAQKKLPVLLKGDRGAIKRKEPPKLLKRVAPKLPLVLFITEQGKEHLAFGYSNGTWFSLVGVKVDGEVRWSFAHLEPYLRRTYKGTTAEMARAVRDGLSGKRKPPAVDEKEKPGLGPEVPEEKKTSASEPYVEPARAVIPTVLVGGPLAMLAMLFPAVFAGWKRWFVLLSIVGTNSTLLTLHWLFSGALVDSWWGSPTTMWLVMTAITVLGTAWAWQRHLVRVQAGEAPAVPGTIETTTLSVLALGMLGLAGYILPHQGVQAFLAPEWWPAFAFGIAMCAGMVYVLWARFLRGRERLAPALATEVVILTALVLVNTWVGTQLQPRTVAGGLEAGTSTTADRSLKHRWTFQLPSMGSIVSSPLVVGDRVYVAAAHDAVFRPYGAVYCLDRRTGDILWTFNDKMKQVFSSPVVVGNRLFIGEGFHEDSDCRIFCLSADKGEKLWDFPTSSHTESTPCVVAGRVYCGAGDDGLFCLDAEHGTKVWNFPSFHIDASPVVVEERVYAGCGIGEEFSTTALFCLDTKKGKYIWRYNTDLPVWSRAVVTGGFVFVGMGNGRLNQSADKPAGAVVCLREEDGNQVWKSRMPDGVLGRLAADKRHLFFGCRDGYFYCLRRSDGARVWRRGMGSPVVAGPVLEAHPSGEAAAERVYATSTGGFLACMEPATGKLIWSHALGDQTKQKIEVIATPVLDVRTAKDGGEERRLYVGLTLESTGRSGQLRCYEEMEER